MSTEDLEQLTCTELIHKLLELFDTNQEDDVDECLDWFLYTYSPEHAGPLVLQNQASLKDPVLLHIIMTKVRDIYEPEIFLETVNVISFLEHYEQEIAQCGVVRSVVTMMDRDIHNTRSQSLGCKILANLAHDVAVRSWIVKVKGIGKIMEAIKRHQNNGEIVIEACRTLTNMAYISKPNKEVIVHEHGVETILDTMTLHKNNVKLVNSGLRALRNIINNKNVMELQQHTLTREVMLAMQLHRPISDIQAHGIWIFIHLMSGKSEIKKYIIEQGALDHIIAAMETHKSDRSVQLAGATALALLAKIASIRILISKQRGVPSLITALQTHRDSVPVQRAVIKTIFRICGNKSIRETTINKSIIQEIVESMKYHPEHVALQRAAIICFLQFAKTPALRSIIQQEAVSYIVLAHNKFTSIPHFQKVSNQVVESLVISGAALSPPNMEVLTNEVNEMKAKVKEKEKLIKKYIDQKGNLEIELEALKEIKGRDKDTDNEDISAKLKKELAKLLQQKESILEDIKKTEGQNKIALAALEELKTDLKEEQRKFNEIQQKKSEKPNPESSDDSTSKKKNESTKKKAQREKSPTQSGVASPSTNTKSSPKGDKKSSDIRTSGGDKKGKSKHGKSKSSDSKIQITVKKEEPPPEPTLTIETKPSPPPSNKVVTPSLSSEPKPNVVGIQIDLAEPPPPRKATGAPLMVDETQQGSTKIERTLSRTLNRHNYTRLSSTNKNSTAEVMQLKKTLDGLRLKLDNTNKEIDELKTQTSNQEALVNKLNIDIKGAHILIQTLQKENQSQGSNRGKLVDTSSSSSVVMRQQKKLKAYKEQLSQLESENNELKKELQALKKKKRHNIF